MKRPPGKCYILPFFSLVWADVEDEEKDDDSPGSRESQEAHAFFLQSVTFMVSVTICLSPPGCYIICDNEEQLTVLFRRSKMEEK